MSSGDHVKIGSRVHKVRLGKRRTVCGLNLSAKDVKTKRFVNCKCCITGMNRGR